MSMRPRIYTIKSLMASFTQVRCDSPDAIEGFRERVESFLGGELREGRERGEWEYTIYFVAHALGLPRSDLPIGDDWAWGAWVEYFDEVENRLPADARELPRWLVFGRGLKMVPKPFHEPRSIECLLRAIEPS